MINSKNQFLNTTGDIDAEDKSSTLKANSANAKLSSMNRFNSDRSVNYSSDKIDNISEASHNSSFTTPSSTSFNSATKLNGSGTSQNVNNLNKNNSGGSGSNTKWCYGLVVFTGSDTKLMKNGGKT